MKNTLNFLSLSPIFSSSSKHPFANPKSKTISSSSSKVNKNSSTFLPSPPISIYQAKVSVKLDQENFLIWRQLVEPVIKGHRLHMFLNADSVISGNADSTNNDQILFSWILSTLSESMLARVIGYNNSKQLWDGIHNMFKNRARAKSRQYRYELKNIRKSTESISEYLLRIKILIDSLALAERPVNSHEHMDAILLGLPEEYVSVVTFIYALSMIDSCRVEEIEYMLLVHEAWIDEVNNESDSENKIRDLPPEWV